MLFLCILTPWIEKYHKNYGSSPNSCGFMQYYSLLFSSSDCKYDTNKESLSSISSYFKNALKYHRGILILY